MALGMRPEACQVTIIDRVLCAHTALRVLVRSCVGMECAGPGAQLGRGSHDGTPA